MGIKSSQTNEVSWDNTMDHRTLLLWKVLKRTLDMHKIFDIIEEEYPLPHKPPKM